MQKSTKNKQEELNNIFKNQVGKYLVVIHNWEEKGKYADEVYKYDVYYFDDMTISGDILEKAKKYKKYKALLDKAFISSHEGLLPINISNLDIDYFSKANNENYNEAEIVPDKLKSTNYLFNGNKRYFININCPETTAIFFNRNYDVDIYEFENDKEYNAFINNELDAKTIKKKKKTQKLCLDKKLSKYKIDYVLTRKNGTFKFSYDYIVDPNEIDPELYSIFVLYPSRETYVVEGEDPGRLAFATMREEIFEKWDAKYFEDNLKIEDAKFCAIGPCVFTLDEIYSNHENIDFQVINTYLINGVLNTAEEWRELTSLRDNNIFTLKKALSSLEPETALSVARVILNNLGIIDTKGNVLPQYKNLLDNPSKEDNISKRTRNKKTSE
ncbi:MAG: hypothetical protein IJA94_00890 [Bacilli bacterium]|nr:hypothetical protein [Bacilli bacterium]